MIRNILREYFIAVLVPRLDIDDDGSVDFADAKEAMMQFAFGDARVLRDRLDFNDDGKVNIDDILDLLVDAVMFVGSEVKKYVLEGLFS